MKIDWFTTLVRHFANVANASGQPTYIGPMLVCCLGNADKPARRVWRQVKVTKHGTIRYVTYGFPLVFYRNFVPKIFDFRNADLENRVRVCQGH